MSKFVDPSDVSVLTGRLGGPKFLLQIRVRGEGGRFFSIYKVNAANVENLRFEANTVELQNILDKWVEELLSSVVGAIQREIYDIVTEAVYETDVTVESVGSAEKRSSSFFEPEKRASFEELFEAGLLERVPGVYERTGNLRNDMVNSVTQIGEKRFQIQIPPVSGGKAWNPLGKTYYPILVDKGHFTVGRRSFVVGRPFIEKIKSESEEIVRVACAEGAEVVGKILNRFFTDTFKIIKGKVGNKMLVRF